MNSRQRSPVFVFGALRSGTTVFRLMLDAHGQISNPGEVDFLFDYLLRDPSHPTGWRYRKTQLADDRIFQAKALTLPEGSDGLDLLHKLIDQLGADQGKVLTLNVHRHVDRLLEVLPQARIIHMLRDPRDVARSSIGMGWAATLYHGINQWIETEQSWDRARPNLASEQVLTLTYEHLVSQTEVVLREVCTFLGLLYSPDMLGYHRRSSYAPPDKTLIEQWRTKSTPREIALLEGKAGRMMQARGYTPTSEGIVPNHAERIWIDLSNRIGIWVHDIRLFGLGIFLSEKLTRRFRLSRQHQYLRKRMSEQVLRQLK